jgi:Sulfotransferase family
MKVIFIAGTSHSGSTLLDLMLNAHPDIVSVGEVENLHQQVAFKRARQKTFRRCSCGAPSLWECEFWSRVNEETLRTASKSLAELDVRDYRGSNWNHAPNTVLFEAISEASRKNFVVDSSKSPRRLAYLLQHSGLEVHPVHLIRNPQGQICSVAKKHGGFLKHIVRYELVHQQIRRQLASVPHSVVRYEDLVLDPERTLGGVLEPLGLIYHPRQLSWAEQVKHNVAGNRMRRQQTSQLVLDEGWKINLNFIQKLTIRLGTIHSRRSL